MEIRKFKSILLTTAAIAISTLLILPMTGNAGNLNPTSSPTEGTMKTLDEIFSAASQSSLPQYPSIPKVGDVDGFSAIHMRLTGENQGVIEGSCTVAGRENTINILELIHEVVSPRDAASGLPTGKRQHKPITITKRIDKSTPLLHSAQTNNENLTNVELKFYRLSASGQQQHYYTITLQNASVSDNSISGVNTENISFTYQKIIWTFEDGNITSEDDWEAPNA
ncbi:MAG: type VI secretion system tube protein Hcp [Anaerohalosphaera sp.]|nr:type VI secretion system tube protein Hcp [Anaerohalosphaera sp.]